MSWAIRADADGVVLESASTGWTASLRRNRVLSICPPNAVSVEAKCCVWRLTPEEILELVDLLELAAQLWEHSEVRTGRQTEYWEDDE